MQKLMHPKHMMSNITVTIPPKINISRSNSPDIQAIAEEFGVEIAQ